MKPGLAKLISPFSIGKFLTEYWPEKPLIVHGVRSGVRPLVQNKILNSLTQITLLQHDVIVCNLPDFNDEYSSVSAKPEDVQRLFANKMGLSFKPTRNSLPEIFTWLDAIQKDLGLSTNTRSRCLIYANPKGAHTGTHYDQNANFVLQITCKKIWRMASNENCENPTVRYTLNTPVDPTTALYSKPFRPAQIEKKMKTVVLRPGSLLYVPRGYWHNTDAAEDSISLNFTYSQPSWADLTADYVRMILSSDPKWRASAFGLCQAKGGLRSRADNEFHKLASGDFDHSLSLANIKFTDIEKADIFARLNSIFDLNLKK